MKGILRIAFPKRSRLGSEDFRKTISHPTEGRRDRGADGRLAQLSRLAFEEDDPGRGDDRN